MSTMADCVHRKRAQQFFFDERKAGGGGTSCREKDMKKMSSKKQQHLPKSSQKKSQKNQNFTKECRCTCQCNLNPFSVGFSKYTSKHNNSYDSSPKNNTSSKQQSFGENVRYSQTSHTKSNLSVRCLKVDRSLTRPATEDLNKVSHRHLACFLSTNDPIYEHIEGTRKENLKKFMDRYKRRRERYKRKKERMRKRELIDCTCQRQKSGLENRYNSSIDPSAITNNPSEPDTGEKFKKCIKVFMQSNFIDIFNATIKHYKRRKYENNLCASHSMRINSDFFAASSSRHCPVCNINNRFYDSPSNCRPIYGWHSRQLTRKVSPLQLNMDFF